VTLKDIVASVHARLANRANNLGRPFQELLEYYGMERFLYRLSRSAHADRFVLKGALMLRVWDAPLARPTRDIDLLGRMDNAPENLARVAREVCDVEVEKDGLVFKASTVAAVRIKEDADYEGVRIRFQGLLGKAKMVVPAPAEISYPTLLDFPGPQLMGYRRESVVAEKFEAMVKLGTLNSRMKDFYDIWLMSRHFDFDGPLLERALKATFEHRKTAMDPSPVALTRAFSETTAPANLWKAFLRRNRFAHVPEHFGDVVTSLAEFLSPVARSTLAGEIFAKKWKPPGPWSALRAPGRTEKM
jgi:Nucleotidyl transferase AbiEii toxin, Type IV TA system